MIPERDLLGNRRAIYQAIKQEPGINQQDLSRKLGVSLGTVRHHVDTLLKWELVSMSEKRLYDGRAVGVPDRRWMNLLVKPMIRALVIYLYHRGRSTPRDMMDDFSFKSSTLAYHLTRATDAGLLCAERDGKNCYYSLSDSERIERFLITYRHRFGGQIRGFLSSGMDVPRRMAFKDET